MAWPCSRPIQSLGFGPAVGPERHTCFGFRARGFGYWVWGFTCGIRGLGFRVWGLGFGVQVVGFEVWGFGCGVRGFGFRVWGSGFGVSGVGFGVRGVRHDAKIVIAIEIPA